MEDLRKRYKVCSTCEQELPVSDFSRDARKKGGLRSNCKSCARASKAEWYVRHQAETRSSMQRRRQRIKDAIADVKSAPCVDCGKMFHFSLMDFDHVGDDKIDSVARIASSTMSIKKVMEEISKCDLVCCLCHRVRTWNRLYPDNQIAYRA